MSAIEPTSRPQDEPLRSRLRAEKPPAHYWRRWTADAPVEEPALTVAATAAPTDGISQGDSPQKLAADALDRWIMDLGDEDADLRKQLREAKDQLVR